MFVLPEIVLIYFNRGVTYNTLYSLKPVSSCMTHASQNMTWDSLETLDL